MELLTPKECARRATVSVSPICALLRAGEVPAFRVGATGGGEWLVGEGELAGWLGGGRVAAPPPAGGPLKYL